jgi:hypothetical protein
LRETCSLTMPVVQTERRAAELDSPPVATTEFG